MKNKIISIALKIIVGKNAASFGRAISTWIGAFILSLALFDPAGAPLDPSLGSDTISAVDVPTSAEVKDGLTVGETIGAAVGMILILASRFVSFLRAKKLDWLGKILGPLLGRSLPSLFRAIMTAGSGLLALLTGAPALRPEEFANQPLALFFSSLILFLAGRVSSAIEDSSQNPVEDPTQSLFKKLLPN